MLYGVTPWLDKVPDGNVFTQKQMDASLDGISLLLVLRDTSALNDSAFPASEWKSLVFPAEGEKDDAVRCQLELSSCILHSGFYNECLIGHGWIFISKSTKCFSRQPPHRF